MNPMLGKVDCTTLENIMEQTELSDNIVRNLLCSYLGSPIEVSSKATLTSEALSKMYDYGSKKALESAGEDLPW
jgi:hypothetical protein